MKTVTVIWAETYTKSIYTVSTWFLHENCIELDTADDKLFIPFVSMRNWEVKKDAYDR